MLDRESLMQFGYGQSTRELPRVVVATNMYPTADDPARGAFVKAQVEALRELGVPLEILHVRGDLSPLNYVSAIRLLRRTVHRFRADLVYAFYGLTGWVAIWQPKPVVLSLAGDDVLGTPNGSGGITVKSRIGIGLSQWAADHARVVCVQSDGMRQRLWGTRLRRDALVVPYGVDPRVFHPGDRVIARRRVGFPEARAIVIFPNTPSEVRKRLELARAAMALVQNEVPNAELRVVARVPHEEMPDYYRAADCLLLTSVWEGSPNVVKEALLTGLPVVSTDVGDVWRWVAHSPESAIAEATPQAIADAVIRVLRAGKRVDTRPFLESLSSPAIASQMLEVFSSVCDQSHGGDP